VAAAPVATARATAAVVATLVPPPRQTAAPAAATRPAGGLSSAHAADFASSDFWTAPAVPVALAVALGGYDRRSAGTAVPIAPTAVVATVSVNRTLADAMTSAVIRSDAVAGPTPAVLAYVDPASAFPAATRVSAPAQPAGRAATTPAALAPPAAAVVPPLTMTGLDTAGLRLWMGDNSTRQQSYALFTMPDATATPVLMSAATAVPASTFAASLPGALRTDRFATDASAGR
jgi:hypothetical protein